MSDGTEQTCNEKGARNEREAANILQRVYGAGVEKVDAFTNHDPFGFVDLIAITPGEMVKFIQVKTNNFSAEHRRKYRNRTRKMPPEHARFEVWVRVDRVGWELYEFDGGDYNQYGTLPCDTSEAGDKYRSLHTDSEQGGESDGA